MTCFEIWETAQALEKYGARARRVGQLLADLETGRAALSAEQDDGQLFRLLKEHVALQDELISELQQQGGGQHGGGHQQAKTEGGGEPPTTHDH
ncbi:MAG: hypothetical protein ACHQ9S_10845 [Candidatus Binatia bacterium]